MWVARVQWRDVNGQKKETDLSAHEVKSNSNGGMIAVNRAEADIKAGWSSVFLG